MDIHLSFSGRKKKKKFQLFREWQVLFETRASNGIGIPTGTTRAPIARHRVEFEIDGEGSRGLVSSGSQARLTIPRRWWRADLYERAGSTTGRAV